MPEVIRFALLCMLLEAIEGRLASLEVVEVQRWRVGSVGSRC